MTFEYQRETKHLKTHRSELKDALTVFKQLIKRLDDTVRSVHNYTLGGQQTCLICELLVTAIR